MPNKPPRPDSVARLKSEYLRELRETLIPWAEANGARRLGLGLPPLRESLEFKVTNIYRTSPGGGCHDDSSPYVTANDAAKIVPFRLPRYAFVLSGKADFPLGVSANMRDPGSGPGSQPCFQIATLSAGQALLLPSGVPQIPIVAPGIHWFHAKPETAACRIFWLFPMPYGVLVHTCETRNLRHVWAPDLFAKEPHLMALTDELVEELKGRDYGELAAARSHLIAILKHVERALSTERLFLLPWPQIAFGIGNTDDIARPAPESTFGRARAFIESHIHENLSSASIARQVSLSSRHLNRIFLAETGTTVMRYVSARRVAVARTLLKETQLPINEIAKIVGIPAATAFAESSHAGRVVLLPCIVNNTS